MTVEQVFTVINILHANCDTEYKKSYKEILNQSQLKESEYTSIRNELVRRKILIISGKGRGTSMQWNTAYTNPTESLAKSVCKKVIACKVYARKTPRVPKPEVPVVKVDKIISYTDTELVEELRKRGYTVTCVKTL